VEAIRTGKEAGMNGSITARGFAAGRPTTNLDTRRTIVRQATSLFVYVMILIALTGIPAFAQSAGVPVPGERTALLLGPDPPLEPEAEAAIIAWEYDQLVPASAFGGASGGYLTVWEDHHWAWGADRDIYARAVPVSGIPVAAEFGVSWDGSNHRLAPVVAANAATGEFLTVWEYAFSDSDHDIYARLVRSDGTLLTGEIAVATVTNYDGNPAVAYNASGNEYLVVWERRVGSDEFVQYDLYGQRLSAAGAPIGGAFAIVVGPYRQHAPAVACATPSTVCLVAWKDRTSTDEYNIVGQRVQSGVLIGGQIAISNWSGDQLEPRLAYNPTDNEFIVVWEDRHWGASSIYGQRVGVDGTLRGSACWIASEGEAAPDVAFLPQARSYIVTWEHEFSASDHDVYARRVAYDGSMPDAEFTVSARGTHEQHPAIAAGAGWDVLITWEDQRNVATMGIDLYASLRTIALPTFSGYVYSGAMGSTTTPLAGVTLQLFYSNNAGSLGNLVGGTTSSAQGAYTLPVYGLCEYYQIIETDPPDYVSVGASTPGGSVVSTDGRMELLVKPDRLAGDPLVSIVPASTTVLTQGKLVVIGVPYEVRVSNGVTMLNGSATVIISFRPEDAANINLATVQIAHWDAQAKTWVSDGGGVNLERHSVSAPVSRLGTFAILAERSYPRYLPMVCRP
jgi:hypothetical protein